jgi:hypothetical protein
MSRTGCFILHKNGNLLALFLGIRSHQWEISVQKASRGLRGISAGFVILFVIMIIEHIYDIVFICIEVFIIVLISYRIIWLFVLSEFALDYLLLYLNMDFDLVIGNMRFVETIKLLNFSQRIWKGVTELGILVESLLLSGYFWYRSMPSYSNCKCFFSCFLSTNLLNVCRHFDPLKLDIQSRIKIFFIQDT